MLQGLPIFFVETLGSVKKPLSYIKTSFCLNQPQILNKYELYSIVHPTYFFLIFISF